MSRRQKLKDSHSVDSTQYGKKMEKTFQAVTKYFISANNNYISKERSLQQYTDLASRMDNTRMSIKNLEDDISALKE